MTVTGLAEMWPCAHAHCMTAVHSLPSAAGGLGLRQPNRTADVCAIAWTDGVQLAVAKSREPVRNEAIIGL